MHSVPLLISLIHVFCRKVVRVSACDTDKDSWALVPRDYLESWSLELGLGSYELVKEFRDKSQ